MKYSDEHVTNFVNWLMHALRGGPRTAESLRGQFNSLWPRWRFWRHVSKRSFVAWLDALNNDNRIASGWSDVGARCWMVSDAWSQMVERMLAIQTGIYEELDEIIDPQMVVFTVNEEQPFIITFFGRKGELDHAAIQWAARMMQNAAVCEICCKATGMDTQRCAQCARVFCNDCEGVHEEICEGERVE